MVVGLVQEASKNKITPPVYLDSYEFKGVPTLVCSCVRHGACAGVVAWCSYMSQELSMAKGIQLGCCLFIGVGLMATALVLSMDGNNTGAVMHMGLSVLLFVIGTVREQLMD